MSFTTTKTYTCNSCGKVQEVGDGQIGPRPPKWTYMTLNGDEFDFCPDCGGRVHFFACKPRTLWGHTTASVINTRMDMSQMEAIVAGVDAEDVFAEGGAE